MASAVVFTLVAGVGAAALWLWTALARDRMGYWRRLAEARGLTSIVESGSGLFAQVVARDGVLTITIADHGSGQHRTTRIEIATADPLPSGLTLRPEDLGTQFTKLRAPEMEVGDTTFDERFYVGGAPAQVLARLDVRTRVDLLSLADRARLVVTPSKLSAAVPQGWEDAEEAVGGVLRDLLVVGRRLLGPCDVPMELARHAGTDPQAQVRLQNLLCLVREYGLHATTPETLRAACSDPNGEIRLRAATELGVHGRDVLLQLAEQWAKNDTLAARAVYALALDLPIERAELLLAGALRKRSVGTALACLERLGRGQQPALSTLAKVLAVEQGELAIAAARALGAAGAADSAAPLLAALGRADVREAAAEGLGRVGSTQVVMDLKQALERHAGEKRFARAARHAIAQIQARASNASPGQISLVVAEAGQVSLVDEGAGQVSLADGPNGQLSFSAHGAAREKLLPG